MGDSRKIMQVRSARQVPVRVLLLDDEMFEDSVDKRAVGFILFDKVCEHLNLLEKDYFGLTYRDPAGIKFWLNHEKKIAKQLKGMNWDLTFEIKFYSPEPSQLTEDITRYQLCLQIRRDIVNERLPCSFLTYTLLGSYTAQSELGDYDTEEFGSGYRYLKDIKFAPHQDKELLLKIAELHRQHKGQSPEEAELHFLENAVRLAMYGVELHAAKDAEGSDITLGVCASGLIVYKDNQQMNRFVWPKVLKISYRRNKYFIKIRPGEFEEFASLIGFKLLNVKMAKRLWKISIEHHSFFRFREPDQPKHTGLMPRFGSRFRYSGRTQFQTRQIAAMENRDSPAFDRVMSKRGTFAGRTHNMRKRDEDRQMRRDELRKQPLSPDSKPPPVVEDRPREDRKPSPPEPNYPPPELKQAPPIAPKPTKPKPAHREPGSENASLNRSFDSFEDVPDRRSKIEKIHGVPTPLSAVMQKSLDKEREADHYHDDEEEDRYRHQVGTTAEPVRGRRFRSRTGNPHNQAPKRDTSRDDRVRNRDNKYLFSYPSSDSMLSTDYDEYDVETGLQKRLEVNRAHSVDALHVGQGEKYNSPNVSYRHSSEDVSSSPNLSYQTKQSIPPEGIYAEISEVKKQTQIEQKLQPPASILKGSKSGANEDMNDNQTKQKGKTSGSINRDSKPRISEVRKEPQTKHKGLSAASLGSNFKPDKHEVRTDSQNRNKGHTSGTDKDSKLESSEVRKDIKTKNKGQTPGSSGKDSKAVQGFKRLFFSRKKSKPQIQQAPPEIHLKPKPLSLEKPPMYAKINKQKSVKDNRQTLLGEGSSPVGNTEQSDRSGSLNLEESNSSRLRDEFKMYILNPKQMYSNSETKNDGDSSSNRDTKTSEALSLQNTLRNKEVADKSINKSKSKVSEKQPESHTSSEFLHGPDASSLKGKKPLAVHPVDNRKVYRRKNSMEQMDVMDDALSTGRDDVSINSDLSTSGRNVRDSVEQSPDVGVPAAAAQVSVGKDELLHTNEYRNAHGLNNKMDIDTGEEVVEMTVDTVADNVDETDKEYENTDIHAKDALSDANLVSNIYENLPVRDPTIFLKDKKMEAYDSSRDLIKEVDNQFDLNVQKEYEKVKGGENEISNISTDSAYNMSLDADRSELPLEYHGEAIGTGSSSSLYKLVFDGSSLGSPEDSKDVSVSNSMSFISLGISDISRNEMLVVDDNDLERFSNFSSESSEVDIYYPAASSFMADPFEKEIQKTPKPDTQSQEEVPSMQPSNILKQIPVGMSLFKNNSVDETDLDENTEAKEKADSDVNISGKDALTTAEIHTPDTQPCTEEKHLPDESLGTSDSKFRTQPEDSIGRNSMKRQSDKRTLVKEKSVMIEDYEDEPFRRRIPAASSTRDDRKSKEKAHKVDEKMDFFTSPKVVEDLRDTIPDFNSSQLDNQGRKAKSSAKEGRGGTPNDGISNKIDDLRKDTASKVRKSLDETVGLPVIPTKVKGSEKELKSKAIPTGSNTNKDTQYANTGSDTIKKGIPSKLGESLSETESKTAVPLNVSSKEENQSFKPGDKNSAKDPFWYKTHLLPAKQSSKPEVSETESLKNSQKPEKHQMRQNDKGGNQATKAAVAVAAAYVTASKQNKPPTDTNHDKTSTEPIKLKKKPQEFDRKNLSSVSVPSHTDKDAKSHIQNRVTPYSKPFVPIIQDSKVFSQPASTKEDAVKIKPAPLAKKKGNPKDIGKYTNEILSGNLKTHASSVDRPRSSRSSESSKDTQEQLRNNSSTSFDSSSTGYDSAVAKTKKQSAKKQKVSPGVIHIMNPCPSGWMEGGLKDKTAPIKPTRDSNRQKVATVEDPLFPDKIEVGHESQVSSLDFNTKTETIKLGVDDLQNIQVNQSDAVVTKKENEAAVSETSDVPKAPDNAENILDTAPRVELLCKRVWTHTKRPKPSPDDKKDGKDDKDFTDLICRGPDEADIKYSFSGPSQSGTQTRSMSSTNNSRKPADTVESTDKDIADEGDGKQETDGTEGHDNNQLIVYCSRVDVTRVSDTTSKQQASETSGQQYQADSKLNPTSSITIKKDDDDVTDASNSKRNDKHVDTVPINTRSLGNTPVHTAEKELEDKEEADEEDEESSDTSSGTHTDSDSSQEIELATFEMPQQKAEIFSPEEVKFTPEETGYLSDPWASTYRTKKKYRETDDLGNDVAEFAIDCSFEDVESYKVVQKKDENTEDPKNPILCECNFNPNSVQQHQCDTNSYDVEEPDYDFGIQSCEDLDDHNFYRVPEVIDETPYKTERSNLKCKFKSEPCLFDKRVHFQENLPVYKSSENIRSLPYSGITSEDSEASKLDYMQKFIQCLFETEPRNLGLSSRDRFIDPSPSFDDEYSTETPAAQPCVTTSSGATSTTTAIARPVTDVGIPNWSNRLPVTLLNTEPDHSLQTDMNNTQALQTTSTRSEQLPNYQQSMANRLDSNKWNFYYGKQDPETCIDAKDSDVPPRPRLPQKYYPRIAKPVTGRAQKPMPAARDHYSSNRAGDEDKNMLYFPRSSENVHLAEDIDIPLARETTVEQDESLEAKKSLNHISTVLSQMANESGHVDSTVRHLSICEAELVPSSASQIDECLTRGQYTIADDRHKGHTDKDHLNNDVSSVPSIGDESKSGNKRNRAMMNSDSSPAKTDGKIMRYTYTYNDDSDPESPKIKSVTYEYVTEYKLNNVKVNYKQNRKIQTEQDPKTKGKTDSVDKIMTPRLRKSTHDATIQTSLEEQDSNLIPVEEVMEKSVCYPLGPIFNVPATSTSWSPGSIEEATVRMVNHKFYPKHDYIGSKLKRTISKEDPKGTKTAYQSHINPNTVIHSASPETKTEEKVPDSKSKDSMAKCYRQSLGRGYFNKQVIEHNSEKYVWQSFELDPDDPKRKKGTSALPTSPEKELKKHWTLLDEVDGDCEFDEYKSKKVTDKSAATGVIPDTGVKGISKDTVKENSGKNLYSALMAEQLPDVDVAASANETMFIVQAMAVLALGTVLVFLLPYAG